jgi:hypothetical protein
MFGAREGWLKDAHGVREEFASKEAAERRATQITGVLTGSAKYNLTYTPKEIRNV